MIRNYGVWLIASCVAFGMSACNPYACRTDARNATYSGQLGQAVAPAGIGERDPGRIFLQLSEWRGNDTQQNVLASVNVAGFVPAVNAIHVHAGTPAHPGRILWESTNGILVRDSVWNGQRELFAGPATWADFWNLLAQGEAFIELHAPSGESASGAVRAQEITGFTPACT